jgi:hypothetical protein
VFIGRQDLNIFATGMLELKVLANARYFE